MIHSSPCLCLCDGHVGLHLAHSTAASMMGGLAAIAAHHQHHLSAPSAGITQEAVQEVGERVGEMLGSWLQALVCGVGGVNRCVICACGLWVQPEGLSWSARS